MVRVVVLAEEPCVCSDYVTSMRALWWMTIPDCQDLLICYAIDSVRDNPEARGPIVLIVTDRIAADQSAPHLRPQDSHDAWMIMRNPAAIKSSKKIRRGDEHPWQGTNSSGASTSKARTHSSWDSTDSNTSDAQVPDILVANALHRYSIFPAVVITTCS